MGLGFTFTFCLCMQNRMGIEWSNMGVSSSTNMEHVTHDRFFLESTCRWLMINDNVYDHVYACAKKTRGLNGFEHDGFISNSLITNGYGWYVGLLRQAGEWLELAQFLFPIYLENTAKSLSKLSWHRFKEENQSGRIMAPKHLIYFTNFTIRNRRPAWLQGCLEPSEPCGFLTCAPLSMQLAPRNG